MSILILQLSDIHVVDATSPVLDRVGQITSAVRGVDLTPDICVVALTGDIANTGRPEQYQLATEWTANIVARLSEALGESVPVHVVAIPGNHDCDFSGPTPARDRLIELMAKEPALISDPATAEACVSVQRAFFTFRDRTAGTMIVPSADDPGEPRLFYEYAIPTTNGSLRIRCLNTAWVSRMQERAGTLAFPEALVTDVDGRDALVVTLMHHPANWLLPMTAREVRRRLQRTCQVVLTGHEHEYAARTQRDEAGGALLHLEGAALHSHGDNEQSAFNLIIADVGKKVFRVVTFEWDGKRYADQPGAFTDWTPFATPSLRGAGGYPVRAEMMRRLADPGVDLRHPTKGALTLDDIFVYPDVREVEQDRAQKQPKIVSARVLLNRSSEGEPVLVTGARESGRTCLAKRLFTDSLELGLVPVLIDGRVSKLRGDGLRDQKELGRQFEEQYDALATDYLALSRDKRVVIVDNYHALDERKAAATVRGLTHFAERVILLAHDLTQHVQDLVSLAAVNGGAPPVLHFHIMPYGHVRREELIARYVSLAADDDAQRTEVLRAEMRRLLDTALGKHYAPSVPVVIVSLLQARAFNDNLNLSQSTYGYYYELLIKRSLANAAGQTDYDISQGYLTALAGELFTASLRRWDEGWFMEFHQRFRDNRKLHIRFTDIEGTLVNRGILMRDGDHYEFRHDYFRYYFTAQYLQSNLTTPEGRALVRELTTHLAEEETANILLFLTHLTKDAAVIDPMLAEAARVFADAERATMERPNAPQGNGPTMDELLHKAVYEDRPIQESRTRYLEALDDAERVVPDESSTSTSDSRHTGGYAVASAAAHAEDERERALRSDEVAEVVSLTNKMYEAFRTMQILGQVLKNFPGTLDGDQKRRAIEAVYAVGLRVLGSVITLIQTRMDEAAQAVVMMLREEHPDMTDQQLVVRARDYIAYFVYISAYGTVQRVAANVGHPLLEPVYDEIEAADPVPSVQLISLALRLDRAGAFPVERVRALAKEFHKNPLALRVLRGLVVTHFHLFDVETPVKQEVCALLEMDYQSFLPQQTRKTRLLSKKIT